MTRIGTSVFEGYGSGAANKSGAGAPHAPAKEDRWFFPWARKRTDDLALAWKAPAGQDPRPIARNGAAGAAPAPARDGATPDPYDAYRTDLSVWDGAKSTVRMPKDFAEAAEEARAARKAAAPAAAASEVKGTSTTGRVLGGVAAAGGILEALHGYKEYQEGKTVEGIQEMTTGTLNAASGTAEALGKSGAAAPLAGCAAIIDGTSSYCKAIESGEIEKGEIGILKAYGGTLMVSSLGFGPAAPVVAAVGSAMVLTATVAENRKEVAEAIQKAPDAALDAAQAAGEWQGRQEAKAGEALNAAVPAAADSALDKAAQAGDWIGQKQAGAAQLALDVLPEAIAEPAAKAGEWLGDKEKAVAAAIDQAVPEAIDHALDRAADAGEWIGEQRARAGKGMAEGIPVAADYALDRAAEAGEWIGRQEDKVKSGLSTAGDYTVDTLAAAGEAIDRAEKNAVEVLADAGSAVYNGLADAGDWMLSWVK